MYFFSHIQAVYVPADDLTDPAPATTFAHLDATTVLSRQVSWTGRWRVGNNHKNWFMSYVYLSLLSFLLHVDCWVGYLPCRGSSWLHIKNAWPKVCNLHFCFYEASGLHKFSLFRLKSYTEHILTSCLLTFSRQFVVLQSHWPGPLSDCQSDSETSTRL